MQSHGTCCIPSSPAATWLSVKMSEMHLLCRLATLHTSRRRHGYLAATATDPENARCIGIWHLNLRLLG